MTKIYVIDEKLTGTTTWYPRGPGNNGNILGTPLFLILPEGSFISRCSLLSYLLTPPHFDEGVLSVCRVYRQHILSTADWVLKEFSFPDKMKTHT